VPVVPHHLEVRFRLALTAHQNTLDIHPPDDFDSTEPMMIESPSPAWHDAVDTRDPAFDGVFLVAITSTRIYCRPVCPSRIARRENRRFFESRQAAEDAGYRACRRCRPELSRGDTPLDAVPRLALKAVEKISAGALNGKTVKALAQELGMSERHLRRAVDREIGASPVHLARTQRLRAATTLLASSRASITRVAYASGFQSLRRFNAAFREHFQMSPSEWRRQALRE
jgi:AraC family transcriptional regulator of adaptative response / DNA-3-methyladenine glycosylase II